MGSIYVICSRQCPNGDGIYTLLNALYKYSTSITNQPTKGNSKWDRLRPTEYFLAFAVWSHSEWDHWDQLSPSLATAKYGHSKWVHFSPFETHRDQISPQVAHWVPFRFHSVWFQLDSYDLCNPYSTSFLHWYRENEHYDVIKWKLFPRYWPFVRGIHRSPVNSPHKGQVMWMLMCLWCGSA